MVTFLGVKNTCFQSNCSSNSSFSVKYLIEVGLKRFGKWSNHGQTMKIKGVTKFNSIHHNSQTHKTTTIKNINIKINKK